MNNIEFKQMAIVVSKSHFEQIKDGYGLEFNFKKNKFKICDQVYVWEEKIKGRAFQRGILCGIVDVRNSNPNFSHYKLVRWYI